MPNLSSSELPALAALPERLYTLSALAPRRTYVLALAILLVTFVALYPALDPMGHCDQGECPNAAQSSPMSSAGLATMCVSAVLAASSVMVLALAALRGRRIVTAESRPEDAFLSLDTPPPRLSPIR